MARISAARPRARMSSSASGFVRTTTNISRRQMDDALGAAPPSKKPRYSDETPVGRRGRVDGMMI